MLTVLKKLDVSSLAFLKAQKPYLETRARLFACVRSFFISHNYLEVDTPIAVSAPAPEAYIEAPATSHKMFLRTSPELQMKMMLAAGYKKIFQIGSCFREGEKGRLHQEEFTMLEWYCAGQSYDELQVFTAQLIDYIRDMFSLSWNPPTTLTVHEAFEKYAHQSVESTINAGVFEEVLCEKVEPYLGNDSPTLLIDYPISQAAFAQQMPMKPNCAERFELYIQGVELANGYGELIDPVIQRERFADFDAIRLANGGKKYPEPKAFLEALDAGIPPSSGCALGLDRLLMLISQAPSIKHVMMRD